MSRNQNEKKNSVGKCFPQCPCFNKIGTYYDDKAIQVDYVRFQREKYGTLTWRTYADLKKNFHQNIVYFFLCFALIRLNDLRPNRQIPCTGFKVMSYLKNDGGENRLTLSMNLLYQKSSTTLDVS